MDSLPERGAPDGTDLSPSDLRQGRIEEPDKARKLRFAKLRTEAIALFCRWIVPVYIGSMAFLAFMWWRTGLLPRQAIITLAVGPPPLLAFLFCFSVLSARFERFFVRWNDKEMVIGRSFALPWLKRRSIGESRVVAWALQQPRWLKRVEPPRYRWKLFKGFRVVRDDLPDGLATFRIQFRKGFEGRYAEQIYGGTDRWLEFTAGSQEIEGFAKSAQQYVPSQT